MLFAGVHASGTAVASSPRPAPALRSRGWQGCEPGPFPAGCQQRWVGAGRAGTGLAAGTAAPRQRHPLPAPAVGSRAGAKAQLGTETLKGSCPGMQRSLVTPNYLLAQTSWQRRFKDSCRADEVTPAPAPLGCSAFPLAEPREEGGGAAWGHGCCQRCCPSEALGKESLCSWSHCSFQNPFLGLAAGKSNLEISGGQERPQRWE